MGELFSESRRNLLAKLLIDVVKFVMVAAVPTEFFAQLAYKSRFIILVAMLLCLVAGWLLCPSKSEKGE